MAKKVEQATDKQETKEETKIIKEDIKEAMEEGKTAKQLTQEIVSDISYTKEDEKKVEQVIKKAMETKASMVASACPFCNTMMTDGIKNRNEEVKMDVLDIAEIVAQAIQ